MIEVGQWWWWHNRSVSADYCILYHASILLRITIIRWFMAFYFQGSHASWKALDVFPKISGHGKSWQMSLVLESLQIYQCFNLLTSLLCIEHHCMKHVDESIVNGICSVDDLLVAVLSVDSIWSVQFVCQQLFTCNATRQEKHSLKAGVCRLLEGEFLWILSSMYMKFCFQEIYGGHALSKFCLDFTYLVCYVQGCMGCPVMIPDLAKMLMSPDITTGYFTYLYGINQQQACQYNSVRAWLS